MTGNFWKHKNKYSSGQNLLLASLRNEICSHRLSLQWQIKKKRGKAYKHFQDSSLIQQGQWKVGLPSARDVPAEPRAEEGKLRRRRCELLWPGGWGRSYSVQINQVPRGLFCGNWWHLEGREALQTFPELSLMISAGVCRGAQSPSQCDIVTGGGDSSQLHQIHHFSVFNTRCWQHYWM